MIVNIMFERVVMQRMFPDRFRRRSVQRWIALGEMLKVLNAIKNMSEYKPFQTTVSWNTK